MKLGKLKNNLFGNFQHYLASLALIWLAIGFYRYNPYYKQFLLPKTQKILAGLAVGYSVAAPVYYAMVSQRISKPMLVWRVLRRSRGDVFDYIRDLVDEPTKKITSLDPNEKNALLFMIVKLFFLPIMINFFVNNIQALSNDIRFLTDNGWEWTRLKFHTYYFPMLITLMFTIDTGYFCFGYTVESEWLGNRVKSVEPTVLGWVVALMCYPPFNSLITGYVPWYSEYYRLGMDSMWTLPIQVGIILCIGVYVWATISLGTKCSNLTNRGVVSTGAYGLVRHPAYVGKTLSWWLALLPIMSVAGFVSMTFWTGVYFVRAITEERHLIADSEYRKYCKRVKYRFIPGLM